MNEERIVKKSLYLPGALADWLEQVAEAEDRSFNKQVVRLLEQARAEAEVR